MPAPSQEGARLGQATSTATSDAGQQFVSRSYRSITVPLTRPSYPAEVTKALALTASLPRGSGSTGGGTGHRAAEVVFSASLLAGTRSGAAGARIADRGRGCASFVHVMVPPVPRLTAVPPAVF